MAPKHLINLKDWSAKDLHKLIEVFKRIKNETVRNIHHTYLSRKNIGLIFEKASLRTRVSFEVGINQLGGSAIELGSATGKMGEREPIADLARVASRYVDGLVVRTFEESRIIELAKYADVPVVNALSDLSHPCQAMGDIVTLLEKWGGSLKGRTLSYIGDSNNVTMSLLRASAKLGLKMKVASPKGYEFNKKIKDWGKKQGFEFVNDPAKAAKGADVLYTDVWTSMGQEDEKEKRLQDFKGFQINRKLMRLAKKDALVMHCLPAHRGEEITHEVIESKHSIVFDQAENRLHIQKAILVSLILGELE